MGLVATNVLKYHFGIRLRLRESLEYLSQPRGSNTRAYPLLIQSQGHYRLEHMLNVS